MPAINRLMVQFKANIANIVTILNLLIGYFSITMALQGEFKIAGLAIFWATLLDRLDGKIATKLKLESPLGEQLDSLSDLVSFGIAPATLLYATFFAEFGTTGFIMTSLFPVAGAVRLARYNLLPTKGSFEGIPITMAGGTAVALAIAPFLGNKDIVVFLGVLLLSFLMVSKFPYSKNLNISRSETINVIFMLLTGLTFIFVLYMQLVNILLLLFSIYVLTGIIKKIRSM